MIEMPHLASGLLCVEWRTVIIPLRPNKGMNVFQVTGLKILGRVGTHIFFLSGITWLLELKFHMEYSLDCYMSLDNKWPPPPYMVKQNMFQY